MRGFVYLHGFVERDTSTRSSKKFIAFFADAVNEPDEEKAFAGAWAYLGERRHDSAVYYFSKYERTAYKELAAKYPNVCSVEDVESLFAEAIMVDLYFDVVKPCTEWPTYDQSIKTLAQYAGFGWRDTHPSGAASIEWFHRWVETGDLSIKNRILEYNEDDCLATGVVLDKIRTLKLVDEGRLAE
jgi:predicted RecB family nuclease